MKISSIIKNKSTLGRKLRYSSFPHIRSTLPLHSSKFSINRTNLQFYCTEAPKPPKSNFFQRHNEEDAEPLGEKQQETIAKIRNLLGYNTNLEKSLIHSSPIFDSFASAFQQSLSSKAPFKLLFPCLYLTALQNNSKYIKHHLLLFADRVKYDHRSLQSEILNFKQSKIFEAEQVAILDYLTEAHGGSLSLVHFEKVKKYVEEETIFEIFNICGLVSFLSAYTNCLQIKIEDVAPKLEIDDSHLISQSIKSEQIFEKKVNEISVNYKGDFEETAVIKNTDNFIINNNTAKQNNDVSEGDYEKEYEKLVTDFSCVSQETLTDLDKRKKVLIYGVKNSFGFIPNFMIGYSKYPIILRSALVLFNSIFQETHSLTPPMKFIIAIEASRGFNYRYLELVFMYLANKEKVPMAKLIQNKFTSNSMTLQKIFNLSREITSSFGKETPFTNSYLESLNLYLSKQQLVEVASSVGYLAYLRYISYSIFPLPEPAIVSFSENLVTFKESNK